MNSIESIYESFLPKLKTLEPLRKKMLKMLILKNFFLFLNMLLFAFITYKLALMNIFADNGYISEFSGTVYMIFTFFIIPGIAIASGIGMYYVFKSSVNKFNKHIKLACKDDLEKLLSIKWNVEKPKSILPLEVSDIFPAYTNIEYDDTFHGQYNDTEFDAQEIKLIMKGSKESKTVFKGIAICMPSNKSVNAQTIVTSKWDSAVRNRVMSIPMILLLVLLFILLGMLGIKIIISEGYSSDILKTVVYSIMSILTGLGIIYLAIMQFKNEQRLQKIRLEDLEFDKKFDVYSANQVEARYLITTSFMERFKNLQTAFGTKNVKCSFFNDMVIFGISTNKDLFEIGNLFVPLNNKKQISKFYAEISSLYNMIDYFKLAQKTGL